MQPKIVKFDPDDLKAGGVLTAVTCAYGIVNRRLKKYFNLDEGTKLPTLSSLFSLSGTDGLDGVLDVLRRHLREAEKKRAEKKRKEKAAGSKKSGEGGADGSGGENGNKKKQVHIFYGPRKPKKKK
jgi:hypothetical protein